MGGGGAVELDVRERCGSGAEEAVWGSSRSEYKSG